jgi:hypothetical protein
MSASQSVNHGWRRANGEICWSLFVYGRAISRVMSALRRGWGSCGCYRASEVVESKGAPGNETKTRSVKLRQERQVPPSTARRPAGMRFRQSQQDVRTTNRQSRSKAKCTTLASSKCLRQGQTKLWGMEMVFGQGRQLLNGAVRSSRQCRSRDYRCPLALRTTTYAVTGDWPHGNHC